MGLRRGRRGRCARWRYPGSDRSGGRCSGRRWHWRRRVTITAWLSTHSVLGDTDRSLSFSDVAAGACVAVLTLGWKYGPTPSASSCGEPPKDCTAEIIGAATGIASQTAIDQIDPTGVGSEVPAFSISSADSGCAPPFKSNKPNGCQALYSAKNVFQGLTGSSWRDDAWKDLKRRVHNLKPKKQNRCNRICMHNF